MEGASLLRRPLRVAYAMTQRPLPAEGSFPRVLLPLAFHTVCMVFACQTGGFGVHTSFLPEELLDDPIDRRGGDRLF
jgi:hypothetical protein